MGLARGGVGSAHFEQPVSASSVRGTRCVGRQSRSARDFAFSRFPQYFLLDDFALRTILKTALNIPMHRSRNVFERSKRAFFCFASDFFALGAELLLSRFILKPPMHTLRFGEKRPRRKKGSPIAFRLEESSILYTWYQSLASISHPGCFPLRPLRLCGETQDSGRLLEETLEIHTLELGWYNLQERELETASLLDRWLYWLLHAHQYDAQTLGSLFSQPEFQKATDSIDRIAKKTEDKAMYDTREKAIRDQQWILNAARREGR